MLKFLMEFFGSGLELMKNLISSSDNKPKIVSRLMKFKYKKSPQITDNQLPTTTLIYTFNGYKPVIHQSAFIHPLAAVTGNVIIGKDVYIGPGAAIRGDWGKIVIEDGCNVQENCTIHMFPSVTVTLKEAAHIGHGAIIHGADIGKNCLVGMNAVVMDRVVIEDECIIGALAFIPEGMKIPARKVVVGNPAKIVKDVSDEMIKWKSEGTGWYQKLPGEMKKTWKECEPLREIPEGRKDQPGDYKTRGKS